MITTGPNDVMELLHNRMPVILPESAYTIWLDPGLKNVGYLSGLLEPYKAEEMEAYPIQLRCQ